MNKLILTLVLSVCVMFAAGASEAAFIPNASFSIDLSAIGGNAGNAPLGVTTGEIDELGGFTTATSTYNAFGLPGVLDTFTDAGTMDVSSFANNGGSVGALNLATTGGTWSMYADWSNLTGSVIGAAGPTKYFAYDPGALVTMYAKMATSAVYTPVATLSVLGGTADYTGTDLTTGTGSLKIELAYLGYDPLFWRSPDGLSAAVLTMAQIDVETNDGTLTLGSDVNANTVFDNGDIATTIFIEGSGSTVHFSNNAIPEPASMLLFGSGLFGLVGAGIKKRKIA